ncbi:MULTISPECIES: hypothetical protein [Pseudomonas]|uniref:hypothetical protein n=1 Tax=Pseudomonas TaxID=286 RepID=UPI00159E996D|nr:MULTISPECIES: hypothetical protein [Pseudomonas]WHH51044.1 hypothetical protein QFA96_26155 [Pseudomonas sp. Ap32]MBP2273848.1 hypothetical protein [Pseudomonas sp. BP6]MBP2287181.1 hypothetical protein [Pseudomonas sp. BP7]NVN63816.1 hypothetical protein [Pseudomonas putida]NVN68542.1 hypothetical protein [Pseudomonas putida]
MDDTSLDTRIFEERLSIKPAPWLTLDTWEDLQLCLRYSQAVANEKYSMETQPQQWFTVALATLQSLKFTLFEHTHKTIVYEPHLLALSDVYSGYLPPPREKGPWFKSLDENVQAALQSAGTRTFTVMNASSHLSIEMDHEGDQVPVAILFYAYCITDPIEPTRKLNLIFDHLGARFNAAGFAPLRKDLQARNREKLRAILERELD